MSCRLLVAPRACPWRDRGRLILCELWHCRVKSLPGDTMPGPSRKQWAFLVSMFKYRRGSGSGLGLSLDISDLQCLGLYDKDSSS